MSRHEAGNKIKTKRFNVHSVGKRPREDDGKWSDRRSCVIREVSHKHPTYVDDSGTEVRDSVGWKFSGSKTVGKRR